jgi:hypothetical protein
MTTVFTDPAHQQRATELRADLHALQRKLQPSWVQNFDFDKPAKWLLARLADPKTEACKTYRLAFVLSLGDIQQADHIDIEVAEKTCMAEFLVTALLDAIRAHSPNKLLPPVLIIYPEYVRSWGLMN